MFTGLSTHRYVVRREYLARAEIFFHTLHLTPPTARTAKSARGVRSTRLVECDGNTGGSKRKGLAVFIPKSFPGVFSGVCQTYGDQTSTRGQVREGRRLPEPRDGPNPRLNSCEGSLAATRSPNARLPTHWFQSFLRECRAIPRADPTRKPLPVSCCAKLCVATSTPHGRSRIGSKAELFTTSTTNPH
jgi:hypothetical protein